MELGDRHGISSTFKASSLKETTELLRGLWVCAPATDSMIGISIAVGAPSLRKDDLVRGSTFSSSAMLGRRWLALARREVGGEVMLPPLFGEMIGDFAGLKVGQWFAQLVSRTKRARLRTCGRCLPSTAFPDWQSSGTNFPAHKTKPPFPLRMQCAVATLPWIVYEQWPVDQGCRRTWSRWAISRDWTWSEMGRSCCS